MVDEKGGRKVDSLGNELAAYLAAMMAVKMVEKTGCEKVASMAALKVVQ